MEEDGTHLVLKGSIVESTAGTLGSREPPLSAEELRQAAEEATAEQAVERMGG